MIETGKSTAIDLIAVELGISRAAAKALAALRHSPQMGDLRRGALKKLAQDYILALMLIAERGVKPTNKELIYTASVLTAPYADYALDTLFKLMIERNEVRNERQKQR